MTYFFARFISINELIAEIDTLDLSEEEKMHLSKLIDSSLHHAILDEILSNLSAEDKDVFLKKLHQKSSDDEMLEFLSKKIDNIDKKIKSVSEELVRQMHKDVGEAKRVKS